ncbi:dual specificity protein kinase TTK [Petromyzon marinus]|uniref:dual specificity protein kinase TTK n=1 Tax=Petromyzon marinus TaxID=7757 RepID=UPI003F7064D3
MDEAERRENEEALAQMNARLQKLHENRRGIAAAAAAAATANQEPSLAPRDGGGGGSRGRGGLGGAGLGSGGRSGIDEPARSGGGLFELMGVPMLWKPPGGSAGAGGVAGSGDSAPEPGESTREPGGVPPAPAADVTGGDTSSATPPCVDPAGPDEWLRFLNRERLRWEASDRSSKGLFRLCLLYAECLETVDASTTGSDRRSYAELHVQYAQLRAALDPGEGRVQFDHARVACRRVARVHVAAAQFALDHGPGVDKSASILRKAREAGAEPRSLLDEAFRRLRAGNKRLISPAHDKENVVPVVPVVPAPAAGLVSQLAPPTPAQVQGEEKSDGRRAATWARRIGGGGGGGTDAAATVEIKMQQLQIGTLLRNAADLQSNVATPTVLQSRENLLAAKAVSRNLQVTATPSAGHNNNTTTAAAAAATAAAAAPAGFVPSSAVATAGHGARQTPLRSAAVVDGSTLGRGCGGEDGGRPQPAASAARGEKRSSCRSQDEEEAAAPIPGGGGGGGAGEESDAGSANVRGDPRLRPSDCKRGQQESDGHPSAKRIQKLPPHRPPPPPQQQHEQLQQQQQQLARRVDVPQPQPVWTADPQPRRLESDQAKLQDPPGEPLKQQQQRLQEELAWREGKGTVTVKGRPYCLLNLIGKGGGGKVYSALDTQRRVIRAVKYVSMSEGTAEMADAYDEELKHLKRLQHLTDKIIQLVEHEVTERCTLMVMELGSVDLHTWLRKTGRPAAHKRCFFWHEMVQVVAAIHKEGIVHGDLKPANFVFVEGNIKLIDFGIAKALRADVTSNVMQVAAGTLNYMAPEMFGTAAKVGPKSDVWALGCILYLMTYGSLPFHKFSYWEKMKFICDHTWPIPFPEVDDDAELVDVLKRCLERDKERRMSAVEVLQHPYLKPQRRGK